MYEVTVSHIQTVLSSLSDQCLHEDVVVDIWIVHSLFHSMTTGVIPKSLPVLWTEPVLRKAAVDREIRFSTEQYGCRQRNDFIKCAVSVLF